MDRSAVGRTTTRSAATSTTAIGRRPTGTAAKARTTTTMACAATLILLVGGASACRDGSNASSDTSPTTSGVPLTSETTSPPATSLPVASTAEPSDGATRLGLADYYTWIGSTLAMAIGEISTAGPPEGFEVPSFASARDALTARADFYRQLGDTFASVDPPLEAQAAHDQYIDAIDKNVAALTAAAERAPESAGPESASEYEYSSADVGYAFVAETNAKCALNRVFDSYGYEPYVFERWCEPAPRPGTALGSPEAPVNDIVLVHEVSAREAHPNMWYDVTQITASSAQPIRFTFENRNPPPYLFNLAIYEGAPESLAGMTPVAQTVAASGPQTQTLEVTLEPGVYTYADNVHAYSMRGTLTVVP